MSWHGRHWLKELGDPEKGFYGWVSPAFLAVSFFNILSFFCLFQQARRICCLSFMLLCCLSFCISVFYHPFYLCPVFCHPVFFVVLFFCRPVFFVVLFFAVLFFVLVYLLNFLSLNPNWITSSLQVCNKLNLPDCSPYQVPSHFHFFPTPVHLSRCRDNFDFFLTLSLLGGDTNIWCWRSWHSDQCYLMMNGPRHSIIP